MNLTCVNPKLDTWQVLCAVVSRSSRGHAVCRCAVLTIRGHRDVSLLSPCRNIFLSRKETIRVFFWLYLVANDSILDYYFIVKMANFLCSGLSKCSSYTNNIIIHWKTLKRCLPGPGERTPRLRTLVLLTKYCGLIPSTYVVAHNHS